MCGIAGLIHLDGGPVADMSRRLRVMNQLIAHRGPDGAGTWQTPEQHVGFAHRRLSIIDLSSAGAQPMEAQSGDCIIHNGEVYNFVELREQLAQGWTFRSKTDTEAVLAAYDRWGEDCLEHLIGMFAFAIWDQRRQRLFCARDRFGIKPFYYTTVDGIFYFASEAKALLPSLPEIATDESALAEYLTFQYCIGENTLFRGIKELSPGHMLVVEDGKVKVRRYWDVRYEVDEDHSPAWFEKRLRGILDDSMRMHLRSDVPVGAYVSGGIDSSLMGVLAARHDGANRLAFNGRFTEYPGYDESGYARLAADAMGGELHVADIGHEDFRRHIGDVIYHLDFPIAGPGSFPQFMVSKLASEHVRVVLGGQGGDEIFGGYARYLLAYFEQSIKAAIDGNYKNGNFIVTIESIVPNLGLLREYKPLMREFWRDGLFGPMDERYFRLANRANDMQEEIAWDELNMASVFGTFQGIFNNEANVRKQSYFDAMTHFDFKCLLPALLTVEDRMSMAHGLESRVPFLDHSLVEFAATLPANIKFPGGRLKQLVKNVYADILPKPILERRDKMGFPVPLKEWFAGPLNGMIAETFCVMKERHRAYINADAVLANFDREASFSRKTWGLLSLELWQQTFHDRAGDYRKMLAQECVDA
ncbi:asparagine synthase (glutamine-hydrolyzing) [Shinella zoogloeoides]|uniref:asparagine synthase (glutamine-hydrolyzing) n=1 Tax=Shinella zoogloeoides TaxID=352475 RepID=A0A6N8TN97_SHIZO|nr:asparagine synthase (glutamine-hydrolyzing) [Shinella zoogloeoides]MXO02718.1 asparagine synthase (glutamine-hydrolyzing) [Shinella zoogloeoides]UEX81832.1 asparagine synthase (glutamine-hydrolyzing) [Shinella zoogloeoides]